MFRTIIQWRQNEPEGLRIARSVWSAAYSAALDGGDETERRTSAQWQRDCVLQPSPYARPCLGWFCRTRVYGGRMSQSEVFRKSGVAILGLRVRANALPKYPFSAPWGSRIQSGGMRRTPNALRVRERLVPREAFGVRGIPALSFSGALKSCTANVLYPAGWGLGLKRRHNPFRVANARAHEPRVARSEQPWALRRNPFGISPEKLRRNIGGSFFPV